MSRLDLLVAVGDVDSVTDALGGATLRPARAARLLNLAALYGDEHMAECLIRLARLPTAAASRATALRIAEAAEATDLRPALATAVSRGHAGVVRALLDAGGSASMLPGGLPPEAARSTLLHRCIEAAVATGAAAVDGTGEAPLPRELAELVADVEVRFSVRGSSSRTVPGCGCAADYAAIVSMLVTAGADPDAGDARGEMPLHFAAAAARGDLVRALIRSGAHVDARNATGITPLGACFQRAGLVHARCVSMEALRDTAQALVIAGANVWSDGGGGFTNHKPIMPLENLRSPWAIHLYGATCAAQLARELGEVAAWARRREVVAARSQRRDMTPSVSGVFLASYQ